jgi:hypothetical protein
LSDQWVIEEKKKEIIKSSYNQMKMQLTRTCDTAKVGLTGKFIAMSAHTHKKKSEIFPINNLIISNSLKKTRTNQSQK